MGLSYGQFNFRVDFPEGTPTEDMQLDSRAMAEEIMAVLKRHNGKLVKNSEFQKVMEFQRDTSSGYVIQDDDVIEGLKDGTN